MFNFFSFNIFLNLRPIQRINTENLNAPSVTLLYFQSIFATAWSTFHCNLSNNFHHFIDFLRLNWNGMFTMLVLALSQLFKFFPYGIFLIVKMKTLTRTLILTIQRSHLCFLRKKTLDKRSFFCYARRRSSVWNLYDFGSD